MAKSNGILAMNPEQYREIDGVVFDLDSYAKHCRPVEQTPVLVRILGVPALTLSAAMDWS